MARWRTRVRRAARRTRRLDFVLLGAVLTACALAAVAVKASGIRVQHTGSLPRGLYREMPHGRPTRGAIGIWCLPLETARWARERDYVGRGACPGGAEPIGKVVLAEAGDTVRLAREGISVNGAIIPHSRPFTRDSRGRAVTPRFGAYVLRHGEVWLWSPYAPRSLDSRYFGPLSTGALVSVVRPVWTLRP